MKKKITEYKNIEEVLEALKNGVIEADVAELIIDNIYINRENTRRTIGDYIKHPVEKPYYPQLDGWRPPPSYTTGDNTKKIIND